MITGAIPTIYLRSGENLLFGRRGLGFLRCPVARLGPVDHLDHGQEQQAEVLQLDEIVADLPVLKAVRQRLGRGVDGLEGGGGLLDPPFLRWPFSSPPFTIRKNGFTQPRRAWRCRSVRRNSSRWRCGNGGGSRVFSASAVI